MFLKLPANLNFLKYSYSFLRMSIILFATVACCECFQFSITWLSDEISGIFFLSNLLFISFSLRCLGCNFLWHIYFWNWLIIVKLWSTHIIIDWLIFFIFFVSHVKFIRFFRELSYPSLASRERHRLKIFLIESSPWQIDVHARVEDFRPESRFILLYVVFSYFGPKALSLMY